MELRGLGDPPKFDEGAIDGPVLLYQAKSFNFKAIDGIIILIKPDELNDELNAKEEKKKLPMFPFRLHWHQLPTRRLDHTSFEIRWEVQLIMRNAPAPPFG